MSTTFKEWRDKGEFLRVDRVQVHDSRLQVAATVYIKSYPKRSRLLVGNRRGKSKFMDQINHTAHDSDCDSPNETEEPPGALSRLELDPITTKPKNALKQEAYSLSDLKHVVPF